MNVIIILIINCLFFITSTRDCLNQCVFQGSRVKSSHYEVKFIYINALCAANYKLFKTTNDCQSVVINKFSKSIISVHKLYQNYPNPFNPFATIDFEIPAEDNIKLLVYDVLGKEVIRVIESRLRAGKYSVNIDASNWSTGIYFYILNN